MPKQTRSAFYSIYLFSIKLIMAHRTGEANKTKVKSSCRFQPAQALRGRGRRRKQAWASGASNWLKGRGAVSGSRSAVAHQWHSNPQIGTLTKRKEGVGLCNAKKNTSLFLPPPPHFLLSACTNLSPFLLSAFILTSCLFTDTVILHRLPLSMFVLGTHVYTHTAPPRGVLSFLYLS